jgi:galactose-1-phosphate uridylyltransferase
MNSEKLSLKKTQIKKTKWPMSVLSIPSKIKKKLKKIPNKARESALSPKQKDMVL